MTSVARVRYRPAAARSAKLSPATLQPFGRPLAMGYRWCALAVVLVAGVSGRGIPDDVIDASGNSASNYSVFRILPRNEQQFTFLRNIYDNATQLNLNFWKVAKNKNGFFDVMANEESQDFLLKKLQKEGIDYLKTIENVEEMIKTRENGPREVRLHDDADVPFYDFKHYSSYPQMVSYMRALARKYPKIVQFISVGTTHEGRSIDGLEIGSRDASKKIFWVDGGIHAREWAAPHTALYFIHQLTSRAEDPEIRKYVEKMTFVIVPCLNPDGYEFTRSSSNPHVRLWRKNRSPIQCRKDDWGRNRCCRGVDLNRNFDFHFRESGSSDDPCSEIYQGTAAFSEPETRAVRDAILSRRYRGRIEGFITLHTYSQIWIHPYGHRKDSYPGDIQELYDVGKKATKELEKMYGTKYILGSGADTLYPASGGSEDWAKKTAKVKFVYLLELRPDEKNWDGFILDEKELIPTAQETWVGIRVVADAIVDKMSKKRPEVEPQRRPFRFGNGEENSCWDMRHACKRWVSEKSDLCKTVPLFMRENCAYSCGYC